MKKILQEFTIIKIRGGFLSQLFSLTLPPKKYRLGHEGGLYEQPGD
jgi:hypothetical protein